ncbi:Longin-like domain-containing protein, partial [Pavlovales sp. CCMP2436]
MVCFSVAVLSKSGKVLVSRQFVDMSRIRIEGLYAAFPKLIGTGNKQHTFVETDKVRYVYQPVESLYFLMITNKQSNIIEDLETLRLLTKLAPEYCHGIDEESIVKHQFELIFALDEVISLGYKENVNMVHIRAFTEMESHEEKLANMIKASKINEAKEEMKRKVTQIDKQKAEQRKGGDGGMAMASMEGFGRMLSDSTSSLPMVSPMAGTDYRPPEDYAKSMASLPTKSLKAGGGMQLGKKNTKVDLMAAMASEGAIVPSPVPGARPIAAATGVAAAAAASGALQLNVEEKVSLKIYRLKQGYYSLEVKGDLQLLVSNPAVGKLSVAVSFGENAGFQ